MEEKGNKEDEQAETIQVTPVESPSENYLVTEHLQRMPNIFSRGLLYLIVLLIFIALIFSLVSKIDIVVECDSVVRPRSHKIKIVSDKSGHIEKIFIAEGDAVAKRAPLFLVRSKEVLSYHSKVTVNRLKLEQNRISLKSIESDLAYWKKEARNLTEEFENTKRLYKKRLTSIGEYNNIKSRLERAHTEVKKFMSERKITLKEKKIIEEELEMNIRMLSIKNGDYSKEANENENGKMIRAKQAGIVSELYIRNTGDYVREADLLCTIIPSESPLYMDIIVANKDIGFIETSMEIEYKFDAFPYLDYGTLYGKVSVISPSAVEDGAKGFIYHIQGTLDKQYFEISDKRYYIKPGMTATSELITEKKSIFSILFSKFRE